MIRELEAQRRIIGQFAACFVDHRNPELIEHTVEELVGQRIYGLALGYEDLNDRDRLRQDPLLAVLVGKADATGQDRARARSWEGAGRLEHIEPSGTDAGGSQRRVALQEDCGERRTGRGVFLESVCAGEESE